MVSPVKGCKWYKYPYGDITQYFGENPKLYAHLDIKGHNGVDIVRPWGEHLYSVEKGVVAQVKDDESGYGKHIVIMSKTGKKGVWRDWVYGHLSFIAVKEGQEVEEGQYIGNIGNTGFVVSDATGNGFWKYNPYKGTHLHFGVRELIENTKGWRYSSSAPKVKVVNEGNGFKGRYDPLPLFADITSPSYKITRVGEINNDGLLIKLAGVLRHIGM